jgi:hypothetical protein
MSGAYVVTASVSFLSRLVVSHFKSSNWISKFKNGREVYLFLHLSIWKGWKLSTIIFIKCLTKRRKRHLEAHSSRSDSHDHRAVLCIPVDLSTWNRNILTTTFFMTQAQRGIEPGPPAWESSTLRSEPRDATNITYNFSTYIVNIRVHLCCTFTCPLS